MNKQKLVRAIIEKLRKDLAVYHKAAGAARAEATHEQSKAEHKYDTRGLEASYLARGQSRQAAEIEQAIDWFEKLAIRDLEPGQPIETGALVELRNGQEAAAYFLAARAGGTEVFVERREVLVITPESPLGAQLLGRKAGEKCVLKLAGQKQQFTIAAAW